MYDYLIIGQGIAGTTLAHQLLIEGHKVIVVDNNPDTSSSKIASGLWNPIVLKRMKKVWMADEMIATFNRIFELVDQIEVPTIAAVHGACLGGGMEVAIACDVIVAAKSALFGQPEIKLGFVPPYAAIRLPHLVGPSKAIEVCTTGKRYTAEEAREMGMIGYAVGDDRFSETVEKIVKEIKHCSPLIIRLNKRAVKQHLFMPFAQALEGVSDLFLNTLMKTEDVLEGIASFEEKRRPDWKNK